MRTLVVGGHSRNIGKTALVVNLIHAFPEAHWTAIKITQYGHGVCSVNGENCGCAPSEHTVAVLEEQDRGNRSDTSRFLVAGAALAFWVRTKQGQLAAALPLLREAWAGAENVILESNTLLQFIAPTLYLVVLDPQVADFKESARLTLDRADGFVLRAPLPVSAVAWDGVSPRLLEGRPRFHVPLGGTLPQECIDFVRQRFFGAPVSH